ncbi:hypothetical protein B0H17DRAFT_1251388 [Mycena rosella]|uniref:Uncharacterized protein n=1 Tax=Mycena rosella TaxID=1033263 RepID=A0AAD7DXA9_MYCRO|nr:hypothetical protein B0H17DRAFT_1251388 [Mycena rosella]
MRVNDTATGAPVRVNAAPLYTGRLPFSDTWPDVAAMLKVIAGDRPTRDPSIHMSPGPAYETQHEGVKELERNPSSFKWRSVSEDLPMVSQSPSAPMSPEISTAGKPYLGRPRDGRSISASREFFEVMANILSFNASLLYAGIYFEVFRKFDPLKALGIASLRRHAQRRHLDTSNSPSSPLLDHPPVILLLNSNGHADPDYVQIYDAMLLLFVIVHFLSKQPTTAQSLHARGPADSCDDINNCRKLFDIVWGCLITIFAYTWVSVHPNVPPPDQSRLALLWRRLKMMLIAVLAPEVMVGFATRQFLVARNFSKEFNISITHGFFFSMGGFVSHMGHPITTLAQVEEPDSEYLSDMKKVKVSSIMDKSKGDALSKGVALAQGLWFTTQCLARVHQHLPITELEIATLAFAVVNVFIWGLWWKKPLDVEEAIPIGPADSEPAEALTLHLNTLDRFITLVTGEYSDLYKPKLSTSVPTFWSAEYRKGDSRYQTYALLIECLVGAIFGAIHCAAWNTRFPSTDELWMWRVCSLSVVTIPGSVGVFVTLFHKASGNSRAEDIYGGAIAMTLAFGIPLYIISRLFLIILPFTTLRALPPGAFTDVNWSVFILHLG